MFPQHCSVTQSAWGELMEDVCDVPHRPSHGMVWSSSANWSLLLVMRLKDTHDVLLQAKPWWWSRRVYGTQREDDVGRRNSKTSDTIHGTMGGFLLSSFAYFYLMHVVNRPARIQPTVFHRSHGSPFFFKYLLKANRVSSTTKCSSKEHAQLINHISWFCHADCFKTAGLWLSAKFIAGLSLAPTDPLTMAVSNHTLLHCTDTQPFVSHHWRKFPLNLVKWFLYMVIF